MFAYTVKCSFASAALRDEWLAWMRDEHLRDVLEAGALQGEVVDLDGDAPTCEARYHFRDRAAFDEYVRDHAPRLRARGLERFPTTRGVEYARSSGIIVLTGGWPE